MILLALSFQERHSLRSCQMNLPLRKTTSLEEPTGAAQSPLWKGSAVIGQSRRTILGGMEEENNQDAAGSLTESSRSNEVAWRRPHRF